MDADLKCQRKLKIIFKNGCTPVSKDSFLNKLTSNNIITVLQERGFRAKESSKQGTYVEQYLAIAVFPQIGT